MTDRATPANGILRVAASYTNGGREWSADPALPLVANTLRYAPAGDSIMGTIDLKIEQLVLDTDNPRITHADSQRDALQKVVKDQRIKLVKLAQSIVEKGLSPLERLMVLQVSAKPKQYIPLEGNRRVTVLTFLTQPEVMTGLDMPVSMKNIFDRLANEFDRTTVEPISCYEVEARDEGRYWIELRHNGENEGRGVVNWPTITAARWRKRDLGIQAFDLVIEHGGFSPDQAERIKQGFPLSTLKRLMEVPDVRSMIGLTAKDGILYTELPPQETIKALRKMVLDLADKNQKSRSLNKTQNMVDYVSGFDKAHKPDLKKKTAPQPVEALPKSAFAKKPRVQSPRPRSVEPPPRATVVPRNCSLNITHSRIEEIYVELRTLRLTEARNAIAVLMRVFLELSVDRFLEANKVPLSTPKPGGGEYFKALDRKVREAIDILVNVGVPRANFSAITRALSDKTSPLHPELLHAYVHDRSSTPSPQLLTAAWDHAQPLFERIWA